MTHTLAELDQIVGGLTEQMNDKLDLPEGLSQAGVDYVIDFKAPTADDPSWYRKYKSGWVEQGGQITIAVNTWISIIFPVTMTDTNYTILGSACTSTNTSFTDEFVGFREKSTTGCQINARYLSSSGDVTVCWEVKGMAALT